MRKKREDIKRALFSPDTNDPPEQSSNNIISKEQEPESTDLMQNGRKSEQKIPDGKRVLFRIVDGKFVYPHEPVLKKQNNISSTVNDEQDLEDVSTNYIKEIKEKLLLHGTEFFKFFPDHTDVQRVYDYQFDKELSVADTKNQNCRDSVSSTSKNNVKKHIGKIKGTGSFSTNEALLKNPGLRKVDTLKNKPLVQPIYETIDCHKSSYVSSPRKDTNPSFQKIILPNLKRNTRSQVNLGTSNNVVKNLIAKPKTKAKPTKKHKKRKHNVSSHKTDPKTIHPAPANTWLQLYEKDKTIFRRTYSRRKINFDIKDVEKNPEHSNKNIGFSKNDSCCESVPSTSDDAKYTQKSSSDKSTDSLSKYLTKESVKKKIRFKEENTAENIKGQPNDDILNNAESDNDSSSGSDPETSHEYRKPLLYLNRKGKLNFKRAYPRRKVNLKTWYAKLGGRVSMCDIHWNTIRCTMMDPVTKLPLNGEVLEPVPPYRWSTNVVCGSGENMAMARITGPKTSYYRSAIGVSDTGEWPIFDPSANSADPKKNENVPSVNPEKHESAPCINSEKNENVPTASGNYSPIRRKKNKFSKNTRPKSSVKRENQSANVGEQTPHSASSDAKKKRVPPITPDSVKVANMREEAARSPDCIRVRDVPIPPLSWVDSTELSLLMNYKEDIGITERHPTVFRRNQNLTSRMRAILFEWLMEVCEVYKLRRETYYLAVDYIDRYLSHTDSIKKNHLQLLGISCLFIAAKVEEIYPPKLSELAYVTDGACTDTDMLLKELDVICVLRWDVGPMTVIGWLTLFLQLACTTGNEIRVLVRNSEPYDDIIFPQFSPYQFSKACMILDLSSLDDGMLQFKYSVIAASIVYYIVSREKALFVSGYRWEDIQCCVEWLYPFAVVAYKNLSLKALPTPKETYPRGSALRCVNPNIVLDEAHILQTNVVDLKMLEEVYELVSEIRRDYRNGVLKPATGWSASAEGQGYDAHAVLVYPPLPRIRRTQFRSSSYIQASSRNINRVYQNATSDPPVVISSDSDEIDDAVPPAAGSTSLKQEARDSKNISQSSPFEEQDSSSLMTGSSPDLAAEPVVKLRFVNNNENQHDEDKSSDSNSDGDVKRVEFNEARFTDKIKKSPELKQTEEGDENDSEKNQDEYDSDKLSSTSNSDKNLGEKRRRSDTDDEDSDENGISEDIHPHRKKSCYERNRPCGSVLASPACSGMYLQEGEPASFTLKPNEPEPSMTVPEHPEVFPTRGSHLSMEAFAKVVPKRIPDYVVVDSQFIQTVKDGYYSVRRVTS